MHSPAIHRPAWEPLSPLQAHEELEAHESAGHLGEIIGVLQQMKARSGSLVAQLTFSDDQTAN